MSRQILEQGFENPSYILSESTLTRFLKENCVRTIATKPSNLAEFVGSYPDSI